MQLERGSAGKKGKWRKKAPRSRRRKLRRLPLSPTIQLTSDAFLAFAAETSFV